MSGRIWAALLFLGVCLMLGGRAALPRGKRSEGRAQTLRKDKHAKRLDVEEGQSEMSFVNTKETPSSKLKGGESMILARRTMNFASGSDPTLIKETKRAEITANPVSLSDTTENTDFALIITNKYPKDISQSFTRVSHPSHNSEYLDSELTESSHPDEKQIIADRMTLSSVSSDGRKSLDANSSSSDASVFLLKPQFGLNNGQEGQSIVMGNQEENTSETAGIDFRNTFRGPSMDKMTSRVRRRRSWIWNQFFVIEEYSGPEPVLIGRVRLNSYYYT